MHARNTVRYLIEDAGAFIALATVLVSLVAVPALRARGYGLIGLVVSGVLASACVWVLYDRLSNPP